MEDRIKRKKGKYRDPGNYEFIRNYLRLSLNRRREFDRSISTKRYSSHSTLTKEFLFFNISLCRFEIDEIEKKITIFTDLTKIQQRNGIDIIREIIKIIN